MKLKIDYGRDGLEIEVPESAPVLQMAAGAGLDRIEEHLNEAIAHPMGTAGLRQLAKGRKNACVVIADITRPVPNSVILPPMLRILEEEGIARDNITILVGTGLHRPNEGEELLQLVGTEIARDYRIVNHMARERETLTYLGETSGGAPIWIDTLYVEADLKIATSLIEPHLMAGYSGGRKAICPGLMGSIRCGSCTALNCSGTPMLVRGKSRAIRSTAKRLKWHSGPVLILRLTWR